MLLVLSATNTTATMEQPAVVHFGPASMETCDTVYPRSGRVCKEVQH